MANGLEVIARRHQFDFSKEGVMPHFSGKNGVDFEIMRRLDVPPKLGTNEFLAQIGFPAYVVNIMLFAHSNRFANQQSNYDLFTEGIRMYRDIQGFQSWIPGNIQGDEIKLEGIRTEVVAALEILHQSWKVLASRGMKYVLTEESPIDIVRQGEGYLRKRALRFAHDPVKSREIGYRIYLFERYVGGKEVQVPPPFRMNTH